MENEHYIKLGRDTLRGITALGVLRRLGCEIVYDGDKGPPQLTVRVPAKISGVAVLGILRDHWDVFVLAAAAEDRCARMVFRGGPLDGEMHAESAGVPVARNVAKRRWAAYFTDGRCTAHFVGYARSRAKALQIAGFAITEHRW